MRLQVEPQTRIRESGFETSKQAKELPCAFNFLVMVKAGLEERKKKKNSVWIQGVLKMLQKQFTKAFPDIHFN